MLPLDVSSLDVPSVTALVVALVAAASDVRRGTIPDALSAAGVVTGILFALFCSVETLQTAVVAASAASASLYAIRLVGEVAYGQPGMGLGDVKLAAALGALMGWNVLWALYLAAVLGAVVGIAGRASGRLVRLHRVPFAPFIAAGCVVAVVLDASTLYRWWMGA